MKTEADGFWLSAFFERKVSMEIKAVLFDCDGLMFDTEIIAQQIWRDGAREYGITLPDDFFAHITGAGGKDLLDYIESIPGAKDLLAVNRGKRFDLNFWRSINTDCLNRPGLIELFAYLSDNDYPVGICSSSAKEYVLALIGTVSSELHYDTIICGDMVKHAKPDPEIFLRGAKELGVKPENCLVLEDSKQGILASVNAGMHNCFIPDTIIPDEEMEAAIEFRVSSMLEVPALLERIRSES